MKKKVFLAEAQEEKTLLQSKVSDCLKVLVRSKNLI